MHGAGVAGALIWTVLASCTAVAPSDELTAGYRPDLQVAPPAVSDSGPAAGARFTLSATVRNVGDGDAAATTLRYFRSADRSITRTDTEVGTDPVAELAASGSEEESVELVAPFAPGTYYYGACVDAVAAEADTTNNCSTSVMVTVQTGTTQEPVETEARQDLQVTSPSVSDTAPAAGTEFTLSVTVRNAGGESADATTMRYFRSPDATISTADTEVYTQSVAKLASSGSVSHSIELTAPSTPGVYYYGACVDAAADDSDITDDCSASVQVTILGPKRPDLLVTPPTVSDSRPVTGASFTLSATVSNTGDGASPTTTLRYYRSADATIVTSDTEVGSDGVGEIAAGGSRSQSVDVVAPSTHGTYYYGACVDAVTDETDTTNNCSAPVEVEVQVITVTELHELQGQPDLTVTSPTVDDASPEAGTSFALSATVSNTGDGASPTTTLRYYRSTDATITTADTQVGTAAIGKLAASGSSAKSISLTAPETPGAHYYGACVDAVTDESDTADNCSSSVKVGVQKPKYPDLEVATPTVDHASPEAGTNFKLSATVSNTGDGDSPATTLRYYRSTDATITTADTQVGTAAIGKLAASGSSAKSISLTAPETPGAHYYGACVDAVTDESDTADNCSSSVKIDVQKPKPNLVMSQPNLVMSQPNLVMSQPNVDLTNPVTGETFALSAIVWNISRAASAATTLRYYRSADATITTSDTEVGTDAVDALSAYEGSSESISLTAPATVGAYYYGACVDAVTDESATTDNCSASVKVNVVAQQRRVDVSPRTLTLEAVGDSETVTVRILDENGDEDTDASYGWITIRSSRDRDPCCTLKKVDDGLEVTMTTAGSMLVELVSTDAKSARLQVYAYQKATSLEVSPKFGEAGG